MAKNRVVSLVAGGVAVEGNLTIPEATKGLVLFAHGSGSSRHSPRNRYVECFHEKALAGQGQRGGLRSASVIPPIRQASIRTLRESRDPTRCMLGSGQFGRCNLPAILADARSATPAFDQALQRSRPD
jgi:hypothetical protein